MVSFYWGNWVRLLISPENMNHVILGYCRSQPMEYTNLGATGLNVSVAGLGCGGSSRLGQATGSTIAESISIVHRSLDLGVNFFDTAEVYGTEKLLGSALHKVPRDSVIISTKCLIPESRNLESASQIVASLERSLLNLETDYVDVFHLHAVQHRDYEYVCDEIVPSLLREKEKGKLAHLGITETPPNDPRHLMLSRAVKDEFWEVVMVGFHMMHQNARDLIFPHTLENNIGTLIMFAVRSIFSDSAYLASTIKELVVAGKLSKKYHHTPEPLDFLLKEGDAVSVIDAAYRYVRHEPGVDVVLFGTGNPEHVKRNVKSIMSPSLSELAIERVVADMGRLEGVGLDLPRNRKRS